MSYFEQTQEIFDPQKRRIVYSHSEILHRALQFGFPHTVPEHFVSILTKPDTIYVDTRNNVHCYQKHMRGKMYTISALEVEEFGEKYFSINSWFEEKDTTPETIENFIKAKDDEKLNKKMRDKINESKSWMKILYSDPSYFKTKKYQKKGITVVEKNGEKILGVPYNKSPRKRKK